MDMKKGHFVEEIGALRDAGFEELNYGGDAIIMFSKSFTTTAGVQSNIRYTLFDKKDNNIIIRIELLQNRLPVCTLILSRYIHPKDIENITESFYTYNKFIDTI